MKQMEYQATPKREILAEGEYKNYHYVIMSYGTHPCAYVAIPKNHKCYGKDYDDIDIRCHGGLTYSRDSLRIGEDTVYNGYFIGWDYAHYGDYAGYFSQIGFDEPCKKWTTEEILEEVNDVIEQLIKLEE